MSKESFKPSPYTVNPLINIFSPFAFILLTCLFNALLLSCSRPTATKKIYERTQFLMGTLVEIKVVSNDPKMAYQAIDNAFEIIRQIEENMSAKRPGTWMEKISQQAIGRPLEIPKDIFTVVDLCLKYSRLTNGAFDISIGPITRLWQFDKPMETIPDPNDILNILHFVDFNKIHLDKENRTIELDLVGMSLDLGAAAKGYAVDEAVEALKQIGINAGLVNAGGDLKAFGKKPDGEPWHIGIQDPQHPKRIIGSVHLMDTALVTSGDYERYLIYKGIKYHHILDPKTGWPATGCKSVSIACKSALEADILSTGIFVLGPGEGMAFLESLPQIEGMIIDSSGHMLVSSGWKAVLKIKKRYKQ